MVDRVSSVQFFASFRRCDFHADILPVSGQAEAGMKGSIVKGALYSGFRRATAILV
jgi:hypothetical protein